MIPQSLVLDYLAAFAVTLVAGVMCGAAAVAYGIPNCDPWLGYLPKRLAEAHRMEVLKRVRQQQVIESHRAAARVEAG